VAKSKGKPKSKPQVEVVTTYTTAQAAEEIGVSTGWIRSHIAAGTVTPARSSEKRNARYVLSEADVESLRAAAAEDPTAGGTAALAVVSRLEAERANLLAQVAWERAIAQEQQKALEAELARTERLSAEIDLQHARIEALKALSAWDRLVGRHKAI
jgi:capsule polysaccharide export protein KpsE/RkpR